MVRHARLWHRSPGRRLRRGAACGWLFCCLAMLMGLGGCGTDAPSTSVEAPREPAAGDALVKAAYRVTLTATSTTAPADGTTSVAVTATVLNSLGAAMTGVPVSFDSSASPNTSFAPPGGPTDCSGKLRTFVSSYAVGSQVIGATVSRTRSTLSLRFDCPGPFASPPGITLSGQTSQGLHAQGDFDGDGSLDLAVANDAAGTLSVLLGNGNGAFRTAAVYPVQGIVAAAACDLNKDGILDLIYSASATPSSLTTMMGRGDGSFVNPQFYAASKPWGVRCGDLNQDGNLDVVVGANGSQPIQIYFGNGNGTLQAATSRAGNNNPITVAIGKLNGDAYPDLAAVNQATTGLRVYVNNGSGGYGAGVALSSTAAIRHLELADVTGDGNLDILGASGGNVLVYVNDGNASFGTAIVSPAAGTVVHFGVGDFNRDGTPDIIWPSTTLGFLAGNGDGTFAPMVAYSPAYGFEAAQVGDFNGDGLLDAAIVSTATFSAVVAGDGSGGLRLPTFLATGATPFRLDMRKYSGDNKPLLAYSVATDMALEWRQSNGDGTFTTASTQTGLANVQDVVVTDLNNDNRADVVVLSPGNSNSINIFLGNGDGTLQAPYTTQAGNGASNLVAVDLDKDGSVDLAVTHTTDNNVAVLRGLGGGGLAAPVLYGVDAAPRGLAAGFINNDSNPDLVIAATTGNTLCILLGNGDATLQPSVCSAAGGAPTGVALADLNGDGKQDVISSLTPANSVSVRLGNQTATPGAPTLYPVGTSPWYLAAADVDGDGSVDVLVANANDASVSLLGGTGSGTLRPAVAVPSNLLSAASVLLRDVNGDGRLDALLGSYPNGVSTYSRQIPVLLGTGCGASPLQLVGSSNALLAYSSATVDLSGAAELTPSNSDHAGTAFAGSTAVGTSWDPSALQLRLGSAGGCNAQVTNCASLDGSWSPGYGSLVGYWKLDGSGSVAANGNLTGVVGGNLKVNGATASYLPGQLGQGLSLAANGNSYLRYPTGLPAAPPPATLMAWALWNGGADGQRLIETGFNTSLMVSLTPRQGGAMTVTLVYNGNTNNLIASVPMGIGSWQHVAMALTNTSVTLYLNGAQVAQTVNQTVSANMLNGANQGYLGSGKQAGQPPYLGSIDDFAIYGAALDANAVALIYARQAAFYAGNAISQVMGPQSTTPPMTELSWASSLPCGKPLPSAQQSESVVHYPGIAAAPQDLGKAPILLYHCDETAFGSAAGGLDARDDSGQSNHGKRFNGVSLGRPGMFNKSFTFDGNTATLAASYSTLFAGTGASPKAFSTSLWFNTTSAQGGKLIGFGDANSTSSGLYDRHLYVDSNQRVSFGVTASSNVTLSGNAVVNDGRWHHAAATFGGSGMALYVDGALQASNAAITTALAYGGYWRIGGDQLAAGAWAAAPTSGYFSGRLDEVAVYGRALSAAEVRHLWRRGANRLKFQVRACTSMTCADNPNWLGPDGTALTYFSEINNNSAPLAGTGSVLPTAPLLSFASFAPGLSVPSNPYLQYRVVLESDDNQSRCSYGGTAAACSPELLGVRVGPSTYATTGTVTSLGGKPMSALTAVVPTFGPSGCPGGITLQLSNNGGATWYYYTGYVWQVAGGGAATSNTPAQLSYDVLSSFIPQTGPGPVTYRAYLQSSGTTPCSLASVTLSGWP